MIAIESIRIVFWAAAIGPCGSRMFIGERLPIPSSSEKSSAIARRIIAAAAANLTADPHRPKNQTQEPDPRTRPKNKTQEQDPRTRPKNKTQEQDPRFAWTEW